MNQSTGWPSTILPSNLHKPISGKSAINSGPERSKQGMLPLPTTRFPPLYAHLTTTVHLPSLPILHILPELKSALVHGSAVVSAPPGSGKTTILPLALLDEPWLAGKKILILEPRRLAARTAAARMALILGEKVGQTVGYQIRFDRQISPDTRIEVLTEGILTRRLQSDTDLSDTGLIIFDEFHERSIHADLSLALCLELCQLKADLRLLVMSATLDTAALVTLLGGVPVITGDGLNHVVEIEYLERTAIGRIGVTTALGVRRVLNAQSGDVLVFLPGTAEINEVPVSY